MNKIVYIFLLIALFASACRPTPKIEGFNTHAWKADRSGCDGQREQLLPLLEKSESALENLSTTQIVKLLGRPNKEELYRRSQRFFFYDIEGGKACGVVEKVQYRLRFTATDHLIEIKKITTEEKE